MSEAVEAPMIFGLMARVLADLPSIGKDSENAQQGFKFRGIDDVLNSLNPILSSHGVFFVPEVLERVTRERATRSNSVLYEVDLHVRYTFYAPDGSSVTASGWGEGTDSGDKSTAKAMTGALKYVLFQAFAIATKEVDDLDGDRHTPEESTPIDPAVEAAAAAVRARHDALPVDARAKIAAWLVSSNTTLDQAIYDPPLARVITRAEEKIAAEAAAASGADPAPTGTEEPVPPTGDPTPRSQQIDPDNDQSPM